MLRIGNQTAFSARPVTEPFEYAIASGFDAFEWFPDKREDGTGWEAAELYLEARRAIREAAARHDICLSVHAPWRIKAAEQYEAQRLIEHLDFCVDIGARLLVMHLDADGGVDRLVETVAPFVQNLARAGITLAIENTPATGPEEFNALFSRLSDLCLAPHYAGMCFDLGHANLCASTRNDYLQYLDRLDPRVPIIHIHAHENYGDSDTHLPLFTGPAGTDGAGITEFVARMKRRHYSGSVILEQWPDPHSMLNYARERLLQMFGE